MTKLFIPEVGMALATRNGQHFGNAFIIGEEIKTYQHQVGLAGELKDGSVKVYHVITDFGNMLTLTDGEVQEMYEVANWWRIQKENSDSLYRHYLTGYNDPIQRIHEQMNLLQDALIYLKGKE